MKKELPTNWLRGSRAVADDSSRRSRELLFLLSLILVPPVFADDAGGFIEPLAVIRQSEYFRSAKIFVRVGSGLSLRFEQPVSHRYGDFIE